MTLLTVFFSLLIVILARMKINIFSVPFISTAVWLLAVFISDLGLVTYPWTITYETVGLVIFSHVFLLLGFFLVASGRKPTIVVARPAMGSDLLLATALVFVVVQFGSTLLSGQIPILGTAGNLAQARELHWSDVDKPLIFQIAKLFSYPAIAFVILGPLLFLHHKRGKMAVAFITFFALIDHSFAEGGRSTLFFTGLGIAVCYFLTYRPGFGRWFLAGILGLFLVYQLASNFYLSRNPNFRSDPNFFIEYNCAKGQLPRHLTRLELEWKAAILSSCYASSPIRYLDDFVALEWPKQFGAYNGGIVFQDNFAKQRESIALYYRAKGVGENPWATSMRDFWIDFGSLAFLAYLPLGALLGWFSRRSRLATESQVILRAMAVCAALLIPFISPLIIRPILFPIIVALILPLACRVLLSIQGGGSLGTEDRKRGQRRARAAR